MSDAKSRRGMRDAMLGLLLVIALDVNATQCGTGNYPFPFTDVAGVGDAFCRGILEAYVLGVTTGVTATTFAPNQDVPRLQMTTFLQRSIDQGLRRNNRRAALGHWWTAKTASGLEHVILPGPGPAGLCKSDGERIWVANGDRMISVQSSTGELRANISLSIAGASGLFGVLAANGRAYGTDPLAAGSVNSTLWTFQGAGESPFWGAANGAPTSYAPGGIAFDGERLWIANYPDGSIAIVPLSSSQLPNVAAGTVVPGFSAPNDILFDGANVWVTDQGTTTLSRLNVNGTIAQSLPVGADPGFMAFDGANLWVPTYGGVWVVRASTGAVVATIVPNATNRLNGTQSAAFDGERILVTNSGNDSVTIFRAADLSFITNIQLATGSQPTGACSDGINFWVTLRGTKQLVRI